MGGQNQAADETFNEVGEMVDHEDQAIRGTIRRENEHQHEVLEDPYDLKENKRKNKRKKERKNKRKNERKNKRKNKNKNERKNKRKERKNKRKERKTKERLSRRSLEGGY